MLKTKSVNDFVKYVQEADNTGANLLETIISYCEINNIEVETIASVIKKDKKLKTRMKVVAKDLHMLKKTKPKVKKKAKHG